MSEPSKLRRHKSILERHPDHVHAIGMISIEVSNLDVFLGEMLGGILRISSELSRIMYLTPRSAFGRLDALQNTAEAALESGSEGLSHIQSLIGRARTITGKRQDLIHHAWVVMKETGEVHQAKLLTREPVLAEPVELKTLQTLVSDLRKLCDDVRQATRVLYKDAREIEQQEKFREQSEQSGGR